VGGTWGSSLRKAGVDGIRVFGKAKGPVYLWITEDTVEIRDASHIWGADTFDTHAMIQAETHPRAVVACIGPAGERGIGISSVMTDGPHGRAAGRCGLGAVMGSKNLKAIATFGRARIHIARREDLLKDVRGIIKSFRENTARLGRTGTPGLVLPQEELGSFPIKNYSQDRWPEGTQKISWPAMEDTIFVRNYRCSGCTIGCGRTVGMGASCDPNLGLTGGLEYEALALLGANLLIDDIRSVQRMNEACNRLGIDVIEAGSLVGFAMEAFEMGILPSDLLEGFEPRWGDGEGALKLIRQMGEGNGLGRFLGQGYRKVLKGLPLDAHEIAMEVKGLGLPAHDPRAYNSVALGYTVTKAALMSIISTVVVFVLDRRSLNALERISKDFSKGARKGIYSFGQEAASAIVGLGKTLDQGAKMAVTVAVACICAGIIVGVITLSGFGLRFSGLISAFSGGYVLFALVLVAMTSIILGMGMSTTADYITVSTLAVPALYVLGVNTLSAHMFAMYFACLSMISPPVALAAYAAAGIAQTGPWRVCFTAMRLGIVAYMIPFMFAYNPALLLVGPVGEVVQACVTSVIGVVALSGATIGFFFRDMKPIERILMGGAGISMVFPGLASDYIGIPLAVVMVAWNYFTRKNYEGIDLKVI